MNTRRRPLLLATVDPATRPKVEAQLGDRVELRYLAELPESERAATLAQADILLTLQPTREIGDAWPDAPAWRFVQVVTAGVDHLDMRRFPPETLIASNVGAFAEPMAEHVLAMALALCKKLHYNHQRMREGVFDQMSLTGTLRGKTAAILGFGGIGHACAALLQPLGVRIHAVNRSGRTDVPVWRCSTLDDLQSVLREADLVIVSLPLDRDTRGVLGAREIGWLKDDVILVNVARGELIDEHALYAFLRDHPQAGAGIDAWWVEPFRHGAFRMDFPFLDLPNVIGSPHNSARAPGWDDVVLERACANLVRYLDGQTPRGVVDRALYAEG
jgi:glycerate dehydrogenase